MRHECKPEKRITATEAREVFADALMARGYDWMTAHEIAVDRVREMLKEQRP